MNCTVTDEELARYAAGDIDPERDEEVERHLAACEGCRRRLDALRRVDELIARLEAPAPPVDAELRVRRALRAELGEAGREVMTLQDVRAFLKLGSDEMAEVAHELPAFEIAGRVRVRRQRLVEWLQARERAYARRRTESDVAWIMTEHVEQGGTQ